MSCCRLYVGDLTLNQMIVKIKKENNEMTWIIRFCGFILWAVAIKLMLSPLEVILDIFTIPFLHFEPGTIFAYLSEVVAIVLSLIGIAFSLIYIMAQASETTASETVAKMFYI